MVTLNVVQRQSFKQKIKWISRQRGGSEAVGRWGGEAVRWCRASTTELRLKETGKCFYYFPGDKKLKAQVTIPDGRFYSSPRICGYFYLLGLRADWITMYILTGPYCSCSCSHLRHWSLIIHLIYFIILFIQKNLTSFQTYRLSETIASGTSSVSITSALNIMLLSVQSAAGAGATEGAGAGAGDYWSVAISFCETVTKLSCTEFDIPPLKQYDIINNATIAETNSHFVLGWRSWVYVWSLIFNIWSSVQILEQSRCQYERPTHIYEYRIPNKQRYYIHINMNVWQCPGPGAAGECLSVVSAVWTRHESVNKDERSRSVGAVSSPVTSLLTTRETGVPPVLFCALSYNSSFTQRKLTVIFIILFKIVCK